MQKISGLMALDSESLLDARSAVEAREYRESASGSDVSG